MTSGFRAAVCLPLLALSACALFRDPARTAPGTAATPAATVATPAPSPEPTSARKDRAAADSPAPAAAGQASEAEQAEAEQANAAAIDGRTSTATQPTAKPRQPPAARKPKPESAPTRRLAAPKAPPKARETPMPAAKQEPAPEPDQAASAPTIAGRLELVSGNRQRVAPGEVADGLVYFLSKAGSPAPKPAHVTIKTHSSGFSPSLVVVPVGSTVSFPNKDSVLHNVFSRTPGSTFDLGTYGPGETRRQVFRKSGLVIVTCNVHHDMRANVVVLQTPYYTRPDKAGHFTLRNLPPGPGTLVLWHPRSRAQTVAIAGPSGPVVRRLTADKPRLHAHTMK